MMRKETIHKISLGILIVLIGLLMVSIIFPTEGKKVIDANIVTEGELKKLSYISDFNQLVMKYPIKGEKIKGVFLYFDVSEQEEASKEMKEEEPNGRILYAVENGKGEVLYKSSVSVDRILHEKSSGQLVGTELPIEMEASQDGILSLVLSGENIPDTTEIRILGNGNRESQLVIEKDGVKYPGFPLFQMEVAAKEFPYLWDICVFLFLAMIMFILTKENHNAADKK